MQKKKTSERVKKTIIRLVLSVLLSFALTIVSIPILTTIFYHDQYGERDFSPFYISMVFIFQLSFWICYTRKLSDDLTHAMREKNSWKEILMDTLHGDGGILMVVVFVLAVIFEVSTILYEKYAEVPGQNPIATALSPIFAISACTGIKHIIIVRTLLAYLVQTVFMIGQIVLQYHHEVRKWNRNA